MAKLWSSLCLLTTVLGFLFTEAVDNLSCPDLPPNGQTDCSVQRFHCLGDHDCHRGDKCCRSPCDTRLTCVRGVCGPECEIGCTNGYELKRDEFGCKLCQCVSACENQPCPNGQFCELRPYSSCSSSSCPLHPTCGACPIVRCSVCPKDWSYKIDQNGCQTCECQDVCAGIDCPGGQKCRPKYKEDCLWHVCNPVPYCGLIDPTLNRACPAVELLTPGSCVEECGSDGNCPHGEKCCYNGCGHTCLQAVCGPSCAIACTSGFELKKDPFGCNLCECVHPCENKDCVPPTYCQLQPVTCVSAPCYPVAVCLTCPQQACSPCPADSKYVVAPNGCQTCECRNVCVNHMCPIGQLCSAQTGLNGPFPVCSGAGIQANYQCPPANPATYGICQQFCQHDSSCAFGDICCDNGCGDTCMRGVCGPVCDLACPPGQGFKKDIYGCEICQCVSLCNNIPCTYGSYCEFQQVPCGSGLCNQESCTPCPAYSCPGCPEGWGRRLDSRGCLGCDCYDVCEGFVCPVGQRCVGLATPCAPGSYQCDPAPVCQGNSVISPSPCSDFNCPVCPVGMVPRRDAFGCHTCLCYNPCESVRCPASTRCQVNQIPCTTFPCGFNTVCVSSPTTYGGAESRQAWWLSMAVLGLFLTAVTLKED